MKLITDTWATAKAAWRAYFEPLGKFDDFLWRLTVELPWRGSVVLLILSILIALIGFVFWWVA